MRLIDADELKKSFAEYGEKAKFLQDFCQKLIDNAQTVEPETKLVANVTFNKEQLEEIVEKAKTDILAQIERPQGEWIFMCGVTCGGYYKCSNCGEVERAEKNYCSNCGADMRGEDNGERNAD